MFQGVWVGQGFVPRSVGWEGLCSKVCGLGRVMFQGMSLDRVMFQGLWVGQGYVPRSVVGQGYKMYVPRSVGWAGLCSKVCGLDRAMFQGLWIGQGYVPRSVGWCLVVVVIDCHQFFRKEKSFVSSLLF